MKLRVSPGFDPLKAQVGPEEYFVLSRIDGSQSMREILLSTGLSVERGIAILTKLRSIGALLLPGETTAPPPGSPPLRPSQPRTDATATPARPITPPRGVPIGIPPRAGREPIAPPMSQRPAGPLPQAQGTPKEAYEPRTAGISVDAPTSRLPPSVKDVTIDGPTLRRTPEQRDAEVAVVLPQPTDAERKALDEACELGRPERLRILSMMRLVDGRDPWALLGVERGSNDKTLKRAYFKLSKEIHPDRFYGKQLGSYGDKLAQVFEAVSRAYAKLTTPEKKAPTGAHVAVGQAEQPQTPGEYAGELFERACALEVSGDAMGAMKLFAAAVRIDPQTRYLRRAASCALAAGQPKTAVEYAKKAQTQASEDPSAARLLAAAFRAAGKLADAEEVLVMAMALKSENDVLTAELRNDLAEVRRQIKASER